MRDNGQRDVVTKSCSAAKSRVAQPLTGIALDTADVDVHHRPLGDGPAADVNSLGALTARHPAGRVEAKSLLQRSLS